MAPLLLTAISLFALTLMSRFSMKRKDEQSDGTKSSIDRPWSVRSRLLDLEAAPMEQVVVPNE